MLHAFFFLGIFVLFIYLLIQLLRFLFFRIIQNQVSNFFPESFYFESGDTWFSIKNLKGSSDLGSIDIENFYIRLNPFQFLTSKKYAFIQITADKLQIGLNISKHKINQNTKPLPIQKWIFIHILTYLVAFLIRTISIVIKNFQIVINGVSIRVSFFMFQYRRFSTDLEAIIKLLRISVTAQNDVISLIPRISMNLKSAVHIVPYLLTFNFDRLYFHNEMLNLDYSNYQLFLNLRPFNICVYDDRDVKCSLVIDPIQTRFVKTNLYTKTLSLLVTSIHGSLHKISCGLATASSNGCSIGALQYASFQKFVLNLPACEISLSLPLIIDFCVIGRKVKPDFANQPNPAFLKKLILNSPRVLFNFNLTDAHRFQIIVDRPRLKNMTLFARYFSCHIVFPDMKHQLFNGTFAQLIFSKPVFILKTDRCNFYLTPMFEETDFLRELFELFLYIQKQVRGLTQEGMDLEPPTRRIMGIEAKHAKFAMRHFPLALEITRANEARRIAVEELLLRQAKAVNKLEARNAQVFNEAAFDNESRAICFKLYREALAAIKPAENYLYKAEGEKVSVFLNGPDLPNKEAAVKILGEKFPKVLKEDIGKVTGGPLHLTAKLIAFQLQNIGDVIRFENADLTGNVFGVKKRPTNISDYYINRIFCDEGKTVIDIPLLSTRGVAFNDMHGTMDYAYSKSAPSILEFFQDSKIMTTVFRQQKYKFTKLSFFDACRMRFQVNWDFQVKEIEYGYNDTLRAFKLNDYAIGCLPNCRFRLINGEFLADGPELIAKVLTPRGYRPLITFTEPHAYTFLPSKNPRNPTGERPLLLPVDSKRLLDPTYDPYEKYRTITFGLIIKTKFAKTPATMDGDLVLPVIEQLLGKHPLSSQFVRMIFFATKFNPRLILNFTEVDVVLPTIYISYHNNDVLAKLIANEDFMLHFNMIIYNRQFSMLLESPSLSLVLDAYSYYLLGLDINSLSFKIANRRTEFLADKINIDISSRIINFLQLFKVKLPQFMFKKIPTVSSMPDLNDIKELYQYFTHTLVYCKVPKITAQFNITNLNLSMKLVINDTVFELRDNPSLAKMMSIAIQKLFVIGVTGAPSLVEICKVQVHHAFSNDRMIDIIQIIDIESNVKSDDLDFFKLTLPRLKSRIGQIATLFAQDGNKTNKEEDFDVKKQLVKKFENKQIALLNNISIKFIQEDRISLLTIALADIAAHRCQKLDGSSSIFFSLFKLHITHDLGMDQFKYILQTNLQDQQTPFLVFKITQPSLKMKFPVFDRIEISLSYFIIRISLPFIKQFKNFFPTAETIQLLDLEQESEDSEEEDDLEASEMQLDEEAQAVAEQNTMFIRQFLFQEFNAELSFRRKTSGAFSEFLNRPLNFPKLHRFDIFGTRKQLTSFVRKTLTKAALMALPKMVFTKTRGIPLTPQQLLEQKQMLEQEERARKLEKERQDKIQRDLELEKQRKQLEHDAKMNEMKEQNKQQKLQQKLVYKAGKGQLKLQKTEQKMTMKQQHKEEKKIKKEEKQEIRQKERLEKKEQKAQERKEKEEIEQKLKQEELEKKKQKKELRENEKLRKKELSDETSKSEELFNELEEKQKDQNETEVHSEPEQPQDRIDVSDEEDNQLFSEPAFDQAVDNDYESDELTESSDDDESEEEEFDQTDDDTELINNEVETRSQTATDNLIRSESPDETSVRIQSTDTSQSNDSSPAKSEFSENSLMKSKSYDLSKMSDSVAKKDQEAIESDQQSPLQEKGLALSSPTSKDDLMELSEGSRKRQKELEKQRIAEEKKRQKEQKQLEKQKAAELKKQQKLLAKQQKEKVQNYSEDDKSSEIVSEDTESQVGAKSLRKEQNKLEKQRKAEEKKKVKEEKKQQKALEKQKSKESFSQEDSDSVASDDSRSKRELRKLQHQMKSGAKKRMKEQKAFEKKIQKQQSLEESEGQKEAKMRQNQEMKERKKQEKKEKKEIQEKLKKEKAEEDKKRKELKKQEKLKKKQQSKDSLLNEEESQSEEDDDDETAQIDHNDDYEESESD